MANLGSLALGVGIVSAIGAVSYLLRQNQSRQFTQSDFENAVKQTDFGYDSDLLALSQDARVGLGLSKSGALYVGKSIGDEFLVRKLPPIRIEHDFGFVNFNLHDFTLAPFTAKFDTEILEAINAKLA